MNSTTKKALIVLVLILVVFAGVLAWSATRDDDDGGASAGAWLKGVGTTFTIKEPLTPSEIWGKCWNGSEFTATSGVPCETLVRTSSTTIRTLRIRMISGLRGRVQLQPRGENGVSCSIPLRSETALSPELQVLKEGATLSIRCEIPMPGANPCRFALSR